MKRIGLFPFRTLSRKKRIRCKFEVLFFFPFFAPFEAFTQNCPKMRGKCENVIIFLFATLPPGFLWHRDTSDQPIQMEQFCSLSLSLHLSLPLFYRYLSEPRSFYLPGELVTVRGSERKWFFLTGESERSLVSLGLPRSVGTTHQWDPPLTQGSPCTKCIWMSTNPIRLNRCTRVIVQIEKTSSCALPPLERLQCFHLFISVALAFVCAATSLSNCSLLS